MRVLQPAELGALAAIDAGPLGREGELVVAAGDQVLLAGEAGHPEGMDHVGRFELDAHRPADRDVDLVGGEEMLVGARVHGRSTSHHH